MQDNKIDYSSFLNKKEKLESQAKTAIFVAINKKIVGLIAIADTLKQDSEKIIKSIQNLNIKTAMITGDNKKTANAIAKQTGITYVISEVLPEGKVNEIKKLQKTLFILIFLNNLMNHKFTTHKNINNQYK